MEGMELCFKSDKVKKSIKPRCPKDTSKSFFSSEESFYDATFLAFLFSLLISDKRQATRMVKKLINVLSMLDPRFKS